MSNNWGFDDANDANPANVNENTGGGGLRQFAESVKAENEKLKNQLAAIQSDLNRQKVESTLATLGIPAEAASQYRGELEPEKVREWATTMQSIFGGAPQGGPAPIPVGQQQAQEPALPASMQSQYQRMNEAGASTAGVGNSEALQAKINDATNIQDLLGAWKTVH